MKVMKKIAIAAFFILFVFIVAFSILVYAGKASLDIKELKNESTQLLAEMYRLNFEVKSIMTATAITTGEIRNSLLKTVENFETLLTLVEKRSEKLLSDPLLSSSLSNARNLWNSNRRDLDLIIKHLDALIELGIDKRTGLISRAQYSYLLTVNSNYYGKERYHFLALENAIDSFTASSYSYSLVFSRLNNQIASSAEEYIRYSILSSIVIVAIVVVGSLILFSLFSHVALVRQIDRLVDETKKKEEEKREAELIALQYQINPHFLYNTLGSIRSYALVAKQEEIADMLKVLCRLLRKTLSPTEASITVREELSILADYISILQIRYKSRIRVDYRIDPNVYDLLMPNLLIQPLIENAVLHGLSQKLNQEGGEGLLRISVRITHAGLIFEIYDDGIGMSEREIEEAFRECSEQKDHEGVHIGISNLHRRIQIQYGKSYGISIHGRKGEFTSVKMKLPLIQYGEHYVA